MADALIGFAATLVSLMAVAAFVWLLIKAFSYFGEIDGEE